MTKVSGQVKWFSNRKGYGFVCSSQVQGQDEIFVHHTSIVSPDGAYRTLAAGADVEFEAVPDEESGKLKAINVTRPGGEPIEPPASDKPRAKSVQGAGSRKSSRKQVDKPNRGGPLKKSPPTSEKNSADPPFHAVIKPSIKDQIQLRGLDLNVKSTVDIALGKSRFKLGQGGYAGYADADCNIGEGSYSCDEDGLVTFTWNRRLKFTNGTWVPDDPVPLPSSVSLQDDSVTLVKPGETVNELWGADKSDPAASFVEHGFLMRRVVLTRPPRVRNPSREK